MRPLPNLSLLSLQGPTVPTGTKKRAAAPKPGALADAPGSSGADDDESEELFGPQTEDEASGSDSPPKKASSQVKKAKPNYKPGASAQKKQGAPFGAATNPSKKTKPPYTPGPSSSKKKKDPVTSESSDSDDTPLADWQPKGKKKGKGKQPAPKKPKPLHVPGASKDNKRKDKEAAEEEAKQTKAKKDVEDASYAKGMANAAEKAKRPNHKSDEVEPGSRERCCGHR